MIYKLLFAISTIPIAFAAGLLNPLEIGLDLSLGGRDTSEATLIAQVPITTETIINNSSLPALPVDNWQIELEICESQRNPLAVNPNDIDNTPSFGLYQFKPSTFELFVKKYDLWYWREWDEAD